MWTLLLLRIQKSTELLDHQQDATSCKRLSENEGSCASRNARYSLSEQSTITHQPGHWPSSYCKITNVYLNSAEKAFYVGTNDVTSIDVCYGTRNMWPITSRVRFHPETHNSNSVPSFIRKCDQVFQTGYVFAIYYYHGSNYFHLHYDAAIPLYYSLHHINEEIQTPKNTIFMPSVELLRGQVLKSAL